MAQFASTFKNEIGRVARREARKLTEPNTAILRELRQRQREQRAVVDSLQRELRAMTKVIHELQGPNGESAGEEASRSRERVTAKGLVAMRKRTQLSAADFGRLAGVTAQTIYSWEQGKSEPREAQKSALLRLRGMGRRAALSALEAMSEKSAPAPAKRRTAAGGAKRGKSRNRSIS